MSTAPTPAKTAPSIALPAPGSGPAPEDAPHPENTLGLPSREVTGAPAESVWTELSQPDGSTFLARGVGDARSHRIEVAGGHQIVQDSTKRWVYVDGFRADGAPRASDRIVGEDDAPRSPGVASSNDTGTALVPAPGNVGRQPTLVILVQFTNRASVGSTPAQWSSKFFGTTASVRAHYLQSSYGKLDMAPAAEASGTANDGVVGWLTLPYAHPDYRSNYGLTVGGVVMEQAITRDAIVAADPFVDYAAYDTNHDGLVAPSELHVTVIVAGYESAMTGSCAPSVWGHQSSLASAYTPRPDGEWVGFLGYTQFGEWQASCSAGGGGMATIGIMAHEIGHDIGWPDLYDTTPAGSPDTYGIGTWSLMSYGAWNYLSGQRSGETPALPDAWAKYYQGWIQPVSVPAGTTPVSLRSAASFPDVAEVLDNPGGVDWEFQARSGTGEYFLIENRYREGFDAALPGCGLLVWHIDETRTSANTANADRNRRLVDLEEADGRADLDTMANSGDPGDPFPGSTGKLRFADDTTPNSRLYGGAASGVTVSVTTTSCASTMNATLARGASAPPANDAFSAAIALPAGSGLRIDSSLGATKQTGEPAHGGNAGGASVWYSWTAPATGRLTLSTAGSSFDTLLGIYQGTAVGSLTLVAGNDDEDNAGGISTSRIADLAVTAGRVYRIAVDGYNGGSGAASGAVNIAWSLAADPPANDAFSAPVALSGASGTLTGTNVSATRQTGEPLHAGNPGGASVWYSWKAPNSGKLDLSTAGSDFDTVLALYSGTALDQLTAVAGNDDENYGGGILTSRITGISVTAGQTYRIAVDGWSGSSAPARTGTVRLAWKVTGTLTAPTPTISGTAKVGVKLTAKPGTWTSGTTLKYQWYVSGTAISGATGSTYTPGASRKGKTLTVKVTGSKSGYTTVAKTSKATKAVAAGTLKAPVPTISGTRKVGSTLKAVRGTWTSGTSFSYAWYANGKAISGAKKATFKLTSGQRGKTITVKVKGTKSGYATVTKTSKATARIT